MKLHVEKQGCLVSMAATWSRPCTPAERNWAAFANGQTSTRATESESAKLATIAESRQQRALPAHAQMRFAHDAVTGAISPLSHRDLSSRSGHCSCRAHRDQRCRQMVRGLDNRLSSAPRTQSQPCSIKKRRRATRTTESPLRKQACRSQTRRFRLGTFHAFP